MKSEQAIPPIVVCDRNVWHGTQAELNNATKITEYRFWQPEGAVFFNEIIHREKVALN